MQPGAGLGEGRSPQVDPRGASRGQLRKLPLPSESGFLLFTTRFLFFLQDPFVRLSLLSRSTS